MQMSTFHAVLIHKMMNLKWWMSIGEVEGADLFFFECSSFPFFTPNIRVIKVLKRRVEEFLTWESTKEGKYVTKHTLSQELGQRPVT